MDMMETYRELYKVNEEIKQLEEKLDNLNKKRIELLCKLANGEEEDDGTIL